MTDKAYWINLAREISFPKDALVAGRPAPAVGGRRFEVCGAIDGRVLTELPLCDHRDVDRAVTRARALVRSGDWRDTDPATRKRVLLKFADLIEDNRHRLALMETLDMGKPISESLGVDIPATCRCLRWTAEAIDKVYGEVGPTPKEELGLIRREPLGVVAAIVPWNFPMIMMAWKIAPALAMGNCVILKPSEKSTLTALVLARLAREAGLPAGVLDVLTGTGPEAGEPLARHLDVDGLAFTGSTAIGQRLSALGAQSNLKRVYVECGGKSPNVVFADTPDLNVAAQESASAVFYNQGEVCTAGSRLLVERSLGMDFIHRVIEHSKLYRPGHPLDPQTKMGAMVDRAQFDRVMTYIEKGVAEGAKLLVGGNSVDVVEGGYYIEPTLFVDVDSQMTICKEEIFGPVLVCQFFDNEQQAVELANSTPFGLAAALWTSDLRRAHRVAGEIRAGSVWVNHYDGGDMTAPFGGYGLSGTGRDKSLHAFEKYSEIKATWFRF